MRDARLDILKETFGAINSTLIVENCHAPLREDRAYLTESKKRFPHLTESFLVENKALIENINFFKVSVKEVQKCFPGKTFAEARAIQKHLLQFAVIEHYTRTNVSDKDFYKKVNESSKLILELEPFTGEDTMDPNSPEAKKWAQMMAATKGKGVDDTIGPKIDTSSGKEAPETKKKKGMLGRMGDWAKGKANLLSGLKTFVEKASEFVIEVAKSKETHKALAIVAVMVILSTIPGLGLLASAVKGALGLYSVFKGSKGMLEKGKELSGGKEGVEGVKEYFKNISNVKEGARLLGQLAQIGLGAWGASSAAGEALTQMKTVAAEHMHNADGAPAATQSAKPEVAPQQAAPVDAPKPTEAPAAPAAPVAPSHTPESFIGKMKELVGDNYKQYLENPEKYNDKILGNLSKMGVDVDGPASEVFKGMRGNMSVREYVEMSLDSIAKSKNMSGA
jgi:hypothetical protein